MTGRPLKELERLTGQTFRDPGLLQTALTHSSAGLPYDNERLEFLGDRVIGLVIAHLLYDAFPQEEEGDLAKRHAALVQGETLAQIAREINLGDILALSDAERTAGGADNDNILADALEATIGALYLDSGMDPCRGAIEKLWKDRIYLVKAPPQDAKTTLQEWAQGQGLPLPAYELTGREGPDHAPVFRIQVTVEGLSPASAEGSSRRAAEKEAARLLLEQLKEKSDRGRRR